MTEQHHHPAIDIKRAPWCGKSSTLPIGNPVCGNLKENTILVLLKHPKSRAIAATWLVMQFAGLSAGTTFAKETPQADVATAIVSQYKAVFNEPPTSVPSQGPVDGALMGNGDTLVAIGGGPGKLEFFVNKNDLWELHSNGGTPHPLARIDLAFPELQGGSYRMEQNLLTAVTRGTFEKDGRTLAMETGVIATENLLWIKLEAVKGTFQGSAGLSLPDQAPPPISGGIAPIQLGREQSRWYLDGAMDDVRIYGRPLSADEIRSMAGNGEVSANGLVCRWEFEGAIDHGAAKGEVSFADGVHGQALCLDGKTGYVDSEPWKPGKAVTVSAFVKVNRPGETAYILSQGEWNQGWSLGLSEGKPRLAIGKVFVQADEALPTGKWVHVVGMCDERNASIYVDGRKVSELFQEPRRAISVNGVQVVERRFEKDARIATGAACALRNLNGDEAFTIEPGKPVILVAAVASLFNGKEFRAAAVQRALAVDNARLAELRKAHESWWRSFWEASFIEIPDKTLEQRYYLSNYVMASASRDPQFPPGIFGWVTTDSPKWGGIYFLNYNFVAPFYGLYAGNHIQQADPCSHPFCEAAKRFETDASVRTQDVPGIYQARTMAPMGCFGAANRAFGKNGRSPEQKTNASYSCVPLGMQWYATYDLEFGRRAYPYVKGVATFWENWLKFENGQYNNYFDPIHEESGDDVNSVLSLGLIRMVMDLALDMSKELGLDTERREKWTHIRDHLAPYPTCKVRDLPEKFWPKHLPLEDSTLDLPIFRYTEKGTPWWKDNTLGIQHIFPAGGIGLDSPPDLLERARNQIRVMNRWVDYNGMNSFYAAAARVGYDPKIILNEMSAMIGKIGAPNGMIKGNPHGMEHQSIVPNAIQEMLLQSYDGVLRLFPCWPVEMDARFGCLRARGAFLVSAELKSSGVRNVTIFSEKGRPCTIQNPWPGMAVAVTRNHQKAETLTGKRFNINTAVGEAIGLVPIKP